VAGPIIPVARAVYLCDLQVGYPGGKSDLYGVFNSIRPPAGYPYVHPQFCVYAELGSGLGPVSCWVDFRHAATGQLVRTTNVYQLHFPNRDVVVQLAVDVQGCSFPHPGVYYVELFCDNQWVADTRLRLL
jgi:hypothetical protein